MGGWYDFWQPRSKYLLRRPYLDVKGYTPTAQSQAPKHRPTHVNLPHLRSHPCLTFIDLSAKAQVADFTITSFL